MNAFHSTVSRARLKTGVISSLVAVAFFAVLVQAHRAPAADETKQPASKKAAPADPQKAEPKDVAAEWKTLISRREELKEQLMKLQKEHETADAARKKEIENAFRDGIEEYQTQLQPRMIELAPKAYAKDPQNFEAGEIVVELARFHNHFEEAIKVGETLLAAGHKSPSLVNSLGIAHFSIHNFDKAHTILDQAKKDRMLSRDGAQFVDASAEYGTLWKQEQQLRAAEEKAPKEKQLPQVELKLDRGSIVLELFEDQAPNTVANFISLVEAGKYNGTTFHRVIPNFMVQGGDPNSLDDDPANDGAGGPGYNINCECYGPNARKHFRGSLSMAHAGPDTGGSQFFITHIPTPWLNAHTEPEKGGHTVFGRVVSGMDVVDETQIGDKIASAKVLRKRNHEYKPETHAEKEKSLDLDNGLLKQLKKKK